MGLCLYILCAKFGMQLAGSGFFDRKSRVGSCAATRCLNSYPGRSLMEKSPKLEGLCILARFFRSACEKGVAPSFSWRRHCLLIRWFQGRPGSYFGRPHTGPPARQLVARGWHRRHLCHRRNLEGRPDSPFVRPGICHGDGMTG